MNTAFPRAFGIRAACWLAILFTTDLTWAQQGEIRHVHDPVMIRAKDAYYVFSTGRGIPIRRSKDLLNWERIGNVFKSRVPEWAAQEVPGTRDIWAPDISYFNHEFHLYYSVSTMGSQRSCIGLATNKTLDPEASDYQWVDHGKVLETFPDKQDYNAIDANLVLDEQGQPWLVWGSYWGGIKLIKLDAETGKPRKDAQIHALAARPNAHAIEAPFIVHHGEYYYLFVSFDRCCSGVVSNYKIMVGRAPKITGPYVDFHNRPMMAGNATLVLASHDNVRGPGHNGICHDGDRDWLVHHMYNARERGMRTMQIRPIIWAAEGWPLAGEPINAATFDPPQLKAEDLEGVWQHTANFAAETFHDLRDNGRIHSWIDGSTWSFKDGLLELRWPDSGAPGGAWVDKCYVAPDGKSYIGRNQTGVVVRGIKYPPDNRATQ